MDYQLTSLAVDNLIELNGDGSTDLLGTDTTGAPSIVTTYPYTHIPYWHQRPIGDGLGSRDPPDYRRRPHHDHADHQDHFCLHVVILLLCNFVSVEYRLCLS